jgi:hypothetical protein
VLEPLDRVCRQHCDQTEQQHHDRVLGPLHLMSLVDAAQAIDQPLDRAQDAVGEGTLTLEDTRHVKA